MKEEAAKIHLLNFFPAFPPDVWFCPHLQSPPQPCSWHPGVHPQGAAALPSATALAALTLRLRSGVMGAGRRTRPRSLLRALSSLPVGMMEEDPLRTSPW